jgi:hypothetical protein
VRAFQVAERGWEVAHACVYHSGVVALAYPPEEAPPRLLHTAWQRPLSDGAPDPPVALNGGAPLDGGAGSNVPMFVPMFTCMAVQVGPPVLLCGNMHAVELQVCLPCPHSDYGFC